MKHLYILFTKRKLIRYYYFINIYIVYWIRVTLIKDTKVNYTTCRQQINQNSNEEVNNYIKNTANTFYLYQYSDNELTVLSHGLRRHIPNKFNGNRVHVQVKQVY